MPHLAVVPGTIGKVNTRSIVTPGECCEGCGGSPTRKKPDDDEVLEASDKVLEAYVEVLEANDTRSDKKNNRCSTRTDIGYTQGTLNTQFRGCIEASKQALKTHVTTDKSRRGSACVQISESLFLEVAL